MTAQTLRTHYTTILDTITKVGFQITSTTASRSPGSRCNCTVSFGLGWVHIKVKNLVLGTHTLNCNTSLLKSDGGVALLCVPRPTIAV